jgi:hypothetical protein
MSTPETGRAQRNPDPYNTKVPAIGHPVITPIPNPIGVTPHFKPQTAVWGWINGIAANTG